MRPLCCKGVHEDQGKALKKYAKGQKLKIRYKIERFHRNQRPSQLSIQRSHNRPCTCLQSEYTYLESGPIFFINVDNVQQIPYLVLKHIASFFLVLFSYSFLFYFAVFFFFFGSLPCRTPSIGSAWLASWTTFLYYNSLLTSR